MIRLRGEVWRDLRAPRRYAIAGHTARVEAKRKWCGHDLLISTENADLVRDEIGWNRICSAEWHNTYFL